MITVQVRSFARISTKAAARSDGDDRDARIGRSMDDNASTNEPWWKVLLGMRW